MPALPSSPALHLTLLALVPLWCACEGDPGGLEETPARYEVVDLGTLGGDRSRAQGINDAGQVVGYAALPDGRTHGFLWEEGSMTDLGALHQGSNAVAINDQGVVVGTSTSAQGRSRGVVWRDGEIVPLEPLEGHDATDAADIDAAGRIVGSSMLVFPEEPSHAVIWSGEGTATDLGAELRLVSISTGPLAGCRKQQFACTTAVVWEDEVVIDIPWTSSAGGLAVDAEDGVAIAYYYDGTGVLWENGEAVELRVPGAEYTRPAALNGAGQVVGDAVVEGTERAFLFEGGVWTDLHALAREAFGHDGAVRTQAHAINASGQIAGARVTAEGRMRAILWDPK